jgi:hypothetical protein
MSLPSTLILPKYSTSWQEEYRLATPWYECGLKAPSTPLLRVQLYDGYELSSVGQRPHWRTDCGSQFTSSAACGQAPNTGSVPGLRVSPPSPTPGYRHSSFHRRAPKGDGSPVFPIRRGAAFVPVELANLANLRHYVRAFLILPLMVAGASQGLPLLRQDRVVNVHQYYNLSKYKYTLA